MITYLLFQLLINANPKNPTKTTTPTINICCARSKSAGSMLVDLIANIILNYFYVKYNNNSINKLFFLNNLQIQLDYIDKN